jgi:hypothetical protein
MDNVEKKEIVRVAVTAAVAAQAVMLALLMVMFVFVAALSDKIDVPGVEWNPPTQQGD